MRHLITIIAALLFTVAHAQNLYVKVGETYKVTAADDHKRVGDIYPAGQDTLQVANGRPGLYWAWQFWKAKGMTYATFRTRYLGCAIANDIAWRYEWDGNIKQGFQNVYAFADWTDASGHWYANATMCLPRGGMKGLSSFGHYDDTNTSQIFASLEFEMTEDWWPANQTERHLFETPNSSLDGANFYSYNEAFTYSGIHLTGPAIYGDGIKRVGMFLRRPGECSKIDQINAAMFQYGIIIQGATPIDAGTITVFWNEICGVGLMGSWGATVHMNIVSGDSNGELVGVHPGYGEESGGAIDIDLLKNEDGILPESAAQPWRGQITLFAEGQYTIRVDVANNSRNSIVSDAIFVVNPKLTNGSPQGSILMVGPHKGFRYRTTLQNIATGKRWEAPADYQGRRFTHFATGDQMFIDGGSTATPGTPCNCPPLGFFRGSGTFDYVNCTPARSGTVTPPSGSWSCTSWSACTNGTQTRTCTCAGTCADPKPAESQTCTVTPPPTGGNLDRTGWTVSVPGTDGSNAGSRMLDGSGSTFWMDNTSMKVGRAITVDMKNSKTVKGVTFAPLPGYNGSYPRSFEVLTSTDGTNFTSRGTFTGTFNASATFTAVTARYVRIVCRSAATDWWNVAEFNVQ